VSDNFLNIQQWYIDADYINTFGMKIIAGRNFSQHSASDADGGVILNKTAAERFGLGNDPVGKKILTFGGDIEPDFDNPRAYTVVGVVEDFHFSSMRENISSLGLFLGKSDGFVNIRFDGNPRPIIDAAEKAWKQLLPGEPFQSTFLDEEFERMYVNEERLAKMSFIFAALAISIACFGLFALTAFTARQRTREIGIRKVFGASVSNIIFLLSYEFSKLLIIAFAIALPLAWYGANWWLESFPYKTVIGISVYLISGVTVLLIAWITTWHHSYRAACTDPVKSIRVDL
jgi:putative ABC transport system permease protein